MGVIHQNVTTELTNVKMYLLGASLQCSCPSYREAEWETMVGPDRERRGLLMVDWMVEDRLLR